MYMHERNLESIVLFLTFKMLKMLQYTLYRYTLSPFSMLLKHEEMNIHVQG